MWLAEPQAWAKEACLNGWPTPTSESFGVIVSDVPFGTDILMCLDIPEHVFRKYKPHHPDGSSLMMLLDDPHTALIPLSVLNTLPNRPRLYDHEDAVDGRRALVQLIRDLDEDEQTDLAAYHRESLQFLDAVGWTSMEVFQDEGDEEDEEDED
jgi:hypothetical protein